MSSLSPPSPSTDGTPPPPASPTTPSPPNTAASAGSSSIAASTIRQPQDSHMTFPDRLPLQQPRQPVAAAAPGGLAQHQPAVAADHLHPLHEDQPLDEFCPDDQYNDKFYNYLQQIQKTREEELNKLSRDLQFGFNPRNVKPPF